jgi:LysR family transcriptional regulator for metE and metH
MNMSKRAGWSRRLDCVAPEGLRRTLYAGYRVEEKEKDYFDGFLKQLDKFSKKEQRITKNVLLMSHPVAPTC